MMKFFKKWIPGLMLMGGIASISAGAWMIYPPAGLISAGVLAIAWWVLDSLDGGEGG